MHHLQRLFDQRGLGKRPAAHLQHLRLHLGAQFWLCQIESDRFVRFNESSPELGRPESLTTARISVVTLLDLFDVLGDGRVCADAVLIHLADQLGLR
eukprot:CAMPEP_0180082996 /NCGR_PEP_ID=MMETSP0985-20121206/19061_1 /TAXON_ID=483367 /ORGANISM="non described non described, Strain CCMP 2436" /LENGTH=96 /DNA_ID=CAMNT_0022016499 /DNA_START=1034 /DNA_END=1324 /DNA_ORIENTATION=-